MKDGILQVTILLLVVLSTPTYQLASGQDYGCRVNITPRDPTELDEVEVQVSFHFRTDPPHVSDFSSVVQKDNVFSVNATVLVPKKDEFVLQVVHTDSFTYELGRLNPGNYTFKVYVKTIHGREQFSCVKKVDFKISHSETTMPEFPSNVYFLIILILTATSIVWMKKFVKT